MKKSEKKLRKRIRKMMDIYGERRSDVVEMLESILLGNKPKKEDAESRYITADINGTAVLYDTYTTMMDYQAPGEDWVTGVECDYSNDEEEEEE